MTQPQYTSNGVARALALRAGGWSLVEIRRLLTSEFGVSPSRNTILTWVSSEYAERKRARDRRDKLRAEPSRPYKVTAERMLMRMHELRERGLSFRAIGQVTAVWFGEELTRDQVESRLAGKRVYVRREAA
jgi:hypothetical protein